MEHDVTIKPRFTLSYQKRRQRCFRVRRLLSEAANTCVKEIDLGMPGTAGGESGGGFQGAAGTCGAASNH